MKIYVMGKNDYYALVPEGAYTSIRNAVANASAEFEEEFFVYEMELDGPRGRQELLGTIGKGKFRRLGG